METKKDLTAEKEEQEVAEGGYTYEYTLKRPFTYEGKTITTLHFDWGILSGKDSNAVEADIRRRGVMIVTAETVPEYWAGMAVRACTDRDENGQRILNNQMMEALPAPDYKRICNRVRTFFLITG